MSESVKTITIDALPASSAVKDEDIFIKSNQIETSKITARDMADYVNEIAKAYTDTQIADLLNGASATLDTLEKIAQAIQENAKNSETNAAASASTATEKASAAATSATSAANSAASASASAENAANSATEAESYAHGGTGTRENEEIDNAKKYYEQAKAISESFSGALRPKGTVTFANLPSLSLAVAGDMYNVSDEFTTTASFKEGSGNVIPAGANVYKTADDYWDVLAGSPVTGVKGKNEAEYRRGLVNLSAENVGALPAGTKYAGSDSTGGDANKLKNFLVTNNINVGRDYAQNAIGYVGNTSEIYGLSDGAIFEQAYSADFCQQIYGDYRTGQIATRGKSSGAWGAWRKQLDSENYTKYTPKLAPQIHYSTRNLYESGYYKIKFSNNNNWMLSCMVMLYQSYRAGVLLVSGYAYNDNFWYSPAAEIVAASPLIGSMPVKFGYDSDKIMWFAVPAGNYTGLTICNINNGYNQMEDWTDIISVEYVSALSGTIQADIIANAPVKSSAVRNIEKVAALPSDAASHPETLYIIPG